MKRIYILLVLPVIIGVGAAVIINSVDYSKPVDNQPVNQDSQPTESVKQSEAPAPVYVVPKDGIVNSNIPPAKAADHLIEITSTGFWPKSLTINKGDSVSWTNRDINPHWIIDDAKNPYPEKGTCGSKLNSCTGIKLGEGFKATLNVTGVWGYYDKLNSKLTGTITIK